MTDSYIKQVAESVRDACAQICDNQHDMARTNPGAARADACAQRIRGLDLLALITSVPKPEPIGHVVTGREDGDGWKLPPWVTGDIRDAIWASRKYRNGMDRKVRGTVSPLYTYTPDAQAEIARLKDELRKLQTENAQ